MRQAAMAAGVSVDITTIDDPNPKQDKYVSQSTGKPLLAKLKVVGYRLQRRRGDDWRQKPGVHWCFERRLKAGEVAMGALTAVLFPRQQLSAELVEFLGTEVPLLPVDVEKVEEVAYNITVYWHEKEAGSERHVIDFLKRCAQLPLHSPDPPDDPVWSNGEFPDDAGGAGSNPVRSAIFFFACQSDRFSSVSNGTTLGPLCRCRAVIFSRTKALSLPDNTSASRR